MSFIDIHTHDSSGGNLIRIYGDKGCMELGVRGIHPMEIPAEDDFKALEEDCRKGKILALGECGLDRRSSVPMDIQYLWFKRQIGLSETYRIPLIIHCVRAYPELLTAYNALSPSLPWIVHGYNNNENILDMLLSRKGFFLSLGSALLKRGSHAGNLLHRIYPSRLFLETDVSGLKIEVVYREASRILGVPLEEVVAVAESNFNKVFNGLS